MCPFSIARGKHQCVSQAPGKQQGLSKQGTGDRSPHPHVAWNCSPLMRFKPSIFHHNCEKQSPRGTANGNRRNPFNRMHANPPRLVFIVCNAFGHLVLCTNSYEARLWHHRSSGGPSPSPRADKPLWQGGGTGSLPVKLMMRGCLSGEAGKG